MASRQTPNRPFTAEEDARLIELRLQHAGGPQGGNNRGVTGLAHVAKALGRTKGSVYRRLRMLAERDDWPGDERAGGV